ncbi:MAG: phosphodiester glycosidase family protein [Armatimonadota bacterium]
MPALPGSVIRRRTSLVFILCAVLALCAGAAAQERSERFIGPGVRLLQWTRASAEGPNVCYAVEVDTTQPLIQLGVSLGRGGTLGLEPLSRQAERLTQETRYPIAGVNGDFFYYPSTQQPGIPTNAAILNGEVIRTPFNRSCLVLPQSGTPSIQIFRATGKLALPSGIEREITSVNHPRGANQLVIYTPWFGPSTRTSAEGTEVYLEPEQFPLQNGVVHRARVRAVQSGAGNAPIAPGGWVLSGSGPAGFLLRGLKPDDVLELKIDFDPAVGPGDQLLGGGPRLVRNGRVSIEKEAGSIDGAFARTRHPRTAIGFNGSKLYLFTVDGRLPGQSIGMSLPELAQAMVDLGCTDALNMDGGGSTTLWMRGSILNRPSDGRERPVANGLLVFSTAPKGEAVRIITTPGEVAALAGAEVPLSLTGEDQHYNPVALPAEAARWSVDPALGTVRDGRFVASAEASPPAGAEYLEGRIRVEAGAAAGEIPVRVYPRPSQVVVTGSTRLGTRLQSTFTVRAVDSRGRPLALPGEVRWEATPELGTLAADGTLLTGEAAARGVVRALVNGVAGEAMVEVAVGAAKALDDFETDGAWKVQTAGGAQGSVQISAGKARSGSRALRLEYDLTTGTGTRAVYALASRPLGQPLAFKLWVFGDGLGTWLRARLRDAKGASHLVDIARNVDWKDTWRELRVPLSEDLPGPISLEAVYVVEPDDTRKPKGALLIDDLTVEQ